jgi:hypothetical protein
MTEEASTEDRAKAQEEKDLANLLEQRIIRWTQRQNKWLNSGASITRTGA